MKLGVLTPFVFLLMRKTLLSKEVFAEEPSSSEAGRSYFWVKWLWDDFSWATGEKLVDFEGVVQGFQDW